MADLTCELVWIQNVLNEMSFMPKTPMRLYCDNRSTNYIIQNYAFHERTEHIEVDCHVVQRKYGVGIIKPTHIFSTNQLADLLINPLGRSPVQFNCNKLHMYNVYAPA